jgi:hypothetical protein
MRCSGGREAQFSCFIGMSHAAPLNAGVRQRRAPTSQCSDAAAPQGHRCFVVSGRAPELQVSGITFFAGAAVGAAACLTTRCLTRPCSGAREAQFVWLIGVPRARPLIGTLDPRVRVPLNTRTPPRDESPVHRQPLPRSRSARQIRHEGGRRGVRRGGVAEGRGV